MNYYEKLSRKAYNKKASNYNNTFDGKFTKKFKMLLHEEVVIKSDYNVLDVACGNGEFLKSLSNKSKFNGFGIDISQNMVECAKKLNVKMEFLVSSCDKTVFDDEFFDVITVCASFHHFPHINKFAQEMKRITKKGATVYIAEVYSPECIRKLNNFLIKFSNAGDVKFYSPNEIVECFSKAGFTRKDVTIINNVQIVSLSRL